MSYSQPQKLDLKVSDTPAYLEKESPPITLSLKSSTVRPGAQPSPFLEYLAASQRACRELKTCS